MLVPLLKKPTVDPSVPNNYRPVTIWSTLSKRLEVFILEVCGHHAINDLQFGFISGRGTNMAVSLVNNVISYCTECGFLFRKVMDVLPDLITAA